MSLNGKNVLSFPIKPETRNATGTNRNKLSNSDKVLIFLIIAIFASLAVAFILALANTNKTPSSANKIEKVQKPNEEVKVTTDNTKKEAVLTPEPKKTKVCIPNSPFPTDKKDIKYTCL